MPTVGTNVLVVLVKVGDAYEVSPERLEFMPGNHAPICEVKDFDDPKVRDTLAAVRKLRHAADSAAPKKPVRGLCFGISPDRAIARREADV